MKKVTLSVAVIVAVIGYILAILASVNTSRIHERLEAERYRRIAIESQLQKAEETIGLLKSDMSDARGKIDGIQRILNGEATDNTNLKDQLKSVAAEKDALKQKVRELEQKVAANQMKEVDLPSPGN